ANTAPFDFDYVTVDDSPTYDSPTDEQHRIVASGLLDLPFDSRISGVATYGSGLPFHVFGPNPPWWNGGRRDETFQLDLRLTKFFDIEDHRFEIFVDAINVTNEVFNPAIEQCNCSPNFGQPFNQILQGRTFQVGARARW